MTLARNHRSGTFASLILAGAVFYFILGIFIMSSRTAPSANRDEQIITAIQPMTTSSFAAMEVTEGEEDESLNQHHSSICLRLHPVLLSTDVANLPNSFGTVVSLPGYSPRTLLVLHQRLLI